MESIPKRRGFMKGKLVMSFYRAPKSPPTTQFSTVKPSSPSLTTSVGFLVDDKFMLPALKQKNSVIANTDEVGDLGGHVDGAIDDSVDKRAAVYISYVQERIKLERVDSDRRKYH